MKRKARTRTGPRRLSLLMLGATALLALALTPMTEAGRKHHWKQQHQHAKQHKHHPVHCTARGCDVRYVRHEVVVPRRIDRRRAGPYQPYFAGEVYYRPHRHSHALYYVPVRTARGVVYEARYYCRGEFYNGGHVAYHGRNVSFRVNF